MTIRLLQLIFVLTTAMLSLEVNAGEHGCHACGGHCVLKASPTTTSHTVYDVECQEICIPSVRFPWDCGPARCGKTRLISKLTSSTQDKQGVAYEWVLVCQRCGHTQSETQRPTPIIPPNPAPATSAPPKSTPAPPDSKSPPSAGPSPAVSGTSDRAASNPFQ